MKHDLIVVVVSGCQIKFVEMLRGYRFDLVQMQGARADLCLSAMLKLRQT